MNKRTEQTDTLSLLKQKWMPACTARAIIPAFGNYSVQYIMDHCMPEPGQEGYLLEDPVAHTPIAPEEMERYLHLCPLYDPATGKRYLLGIVLVCDDDSEPEGLHCFAFQTSKQEGGSV